MKRLLLATRFITVLTLFAATGYSQNYSLKNPYNNFVYAGMQTPLETLVAGYSCKSVTLKAAGGKVEKEGCNFLYFSNKVGIDTISVFVSKSGVIKKIAAVYFFVKEVPDPEPDIGGLNKGLIKKGFLLAQQGVGASFLVTSYGHREHITVDSFTVMIFRNNSIIFHSNNNGNIFNQSIKTAFQSLQSGDKITITNIKATIPTSPNLLLRPLEFEIE